MAAEMKEETKEPPAQMLGDGGSEAQRPLYGRLMGAIHIQHTWGNRLGMMKLPLLLLDLKLYGGAIAQFYVLTRTLEEEIEKHASHPLVAHVRTSVGLKPLAPGYAADLAQIFGDAWADAVVAARTPAIDEYVATLRRAGPVELVAALFILYGALVVGGGKQTQKKVQRVLPGCDHILFDVAEEMRDARRRFKNAFTAIAKDHAGVAAVAPESTDELVAFARAYMHRNNTVVLSVRVLPAWFWPALAVGAVAAAAVAVARRRAH